MRCVLAGLMAFSLCPLARAQSTPTSHASSTTGSAKAPPSADGKPAPASKSDVAGKVELRDIKPLASPAASSPILNDTGPVSTEDVVRGVAKKLVSQGTSESNGQTAGSSSNKAQGGTGSTSKVSTPAESRSQEPAGASDAVMEFQPVPSGSGTAPSAAVVLQGAPSKSPVKRVHGDLYGVGSGAGHAAGGSVGATSKSGKTSVYIQSDEARSKVVQPQ
ncbi:MAG TPA: hypothetical protein VMT20_15795 [Terriglobia bacterium]|nr:hypothetical protein [Terriglobia bacterium]